MSKADEMFEELGYAKVHDENYIYYNNLEEGCTIEFDLVLHTVKSYIDDDLAISVSLSMQELAAINEKCKELGWIREEKEQDGKSNL